MSFISFQLIPFVHIINQINNFIIVNGFREIFDFGKKVQQNCSLNFQDGVFLIIMSIVQESKNDKYRKKYKYMKIRIKSLILVG